MSSTRTTSAVGVQTLVVVLAMGGAFAIAAAFIMGWRSIDRAEVERLRAEQASLAPSIVEISRH